MTALLAQRLAYDRDVILGWLVLALLLGLVPAMIASRKGRGAVNIGITWIETGNRYMLGHAVEDLYYGIWDGVEPGPALMKFPYTEPGKAEAVARFQQLEPGSLVDLREPDGLPAPPPLPAGRPV